MAEKNVVKIMRVPRKWQMSFDLEGKVVMITGASSGLGLEFCLDLVKAGCQIIAAARRTDRLKTLCDEINATCGGRAVAIDLDVTADGRIIDAVVQKAWDAFGHIDALINNAGVRGNLFPLRLKIKEKFRCIKKANYFPNLRHFFFWPVGHV